MEQKKDIIKKVLLGILFILLFLPIIQSKFNFIEIKPLEGAVTLSKDTNLSSNNWFSNVFQENEELFLKDNFGFRNFFVRLNNQVCFSFFKKVNAKDVIIGKDNYLYEESYINAYVGNDFLGKDSLDHIINRVKFINDTLEKLNKKLIIAFAPSKASFFSEYIPDKYYPIKSNTNYKYFSDNMKTINLNIIDFNKWFLANKEKSKYPLYPKLGIHWSMYSSVFVTDSILKYIANKIEKPISKIVTKSISVSDAKDGDLDIAKGLNLLYDIPSYQMAYPFITLDCINGDDKPSLLTVGDSYYWSITAFGIGNCFKNENFWYYNNQVYPESYTSSLSANSLNIGEQVSSHDVFLILLTEPTLKRFGWGFFERLEKHFKGFNSEKSNSKERIKKINDFIGYIKTQPQWLNDAKIRSQKNNIPLDSVIYLDAVWQVDHTQ